MESDDTCCICLETFQEDSQKLMLSCDHVFHSDCLYSLMLNNYNKKITFNTCPLCRKYISTNIQKNYVFNNIKRFSLDSICVVFIFIGLFVRIKLDGFG